MASAKDQSRSSVRRRVWLLPVLSIVLSFSTLFALLEVALRVLPVASGLRTLPVTADAPVLRYTPDREFVYSRDWNFNMTNAGRINNAGFVNDQNYSHSDARPMLAVIGDSYIQAQMVPYQKTLHGLLAKAIKTSRIYSFGASGAPLSQYLVYARYALDEWGAKALVINVVGNDFDESHTDYKSMPGFWYYRTTTDGTLQLELTPLHRGTLTSIVQQSALARYLIINLGLNNLQFSAPKAPGDLEYAGNTATSMEIARVETSLRVIDTFLTDLQHLPGLTPDRVLFTFDGFRYPEAAQASQNSYFAHMRKAFIRRASDLGFEVIDLDPSFFAIHNKTDERFEFPMDGHWNANGHRVAFEAVMNSRLLAEWPRGYSRDSGLLSSSLNGALDTAAGSIP